MSSPAAISLDHFELHEPIGVGMSGQVWRGRPVGHEVPVAVKVLRDMGL